jgi:hypothetical protein
VDAVTAAINSVAFGPGGRMLASGSSHHRQASPAALTSARSRRKTTGATGMSIKDKTVLVTGANRGIGQALTAEALARGARRVYAGIRQPLAHPDERVTPLSLDITSTAQIQAAAGQVESLDMLINNAGIALPDDLTDLAVLERHLAVNLFGTYAVTQAFLPAVTRSRGAIVNILSVNSLAPLPFIIPAYSVDPVASRSCGRTGGKGSRGPARPGGYRYDTGIRHTKGLPGIGRAGNLRRGRQRGRGNLPRSRLSAHGCPLAR